MRKLRLRMIKWHAQGHITIKWRAGLTCRLVWLQSLATPPNAHRVPKTALVASGLSWNVRGEGLRWGRGEATLTIDWVLAWVHRRLIEHFFLCSMVIRSIQFPSSQIRLLPNEGLELSITNANVKISGKWKARKNFMCVSKLGFVECMGKLLVVLERIRARISGMTDFCLVHNYLSPQGSWGCFLSKKVQYNPWLIVEHLCSSRWRTLARLNSCHVA